jgi:adenylyltransferase/sulfurtransferase
VRFLRSFLIGAGGLGCPVTIYSSRRRGNYWNVDFDLIEIHNLHRQILYTEDQVGLPKATTAKALVEKLNPLIKVMAFEEKLS